MQSLELLFSVSRYFFLSRHFGLNTKQMCYAITIRSAYSSIHNVLCFLLSSRDFFVRKIFRYRFFCKKDLLVKWFFFDYSNCFIWSGCLFIRKIFWEYFSSRKNKTIVWFGTYNRQAVAEKDIYFIFSIFLLV